MNEIYFMFLRKPRPANYLTNADASYLTVFYLVMQRQDEQKLHIHLNFYILKILTFPLTLCPLYIYCHLLVQVIYVVGKGSFV